MVSCIQRRRGNCDFEFSWVWFIVFDLDNGDVRMFKLDVEFVDDRIIKYECVGFGDDLSLCIMKN